MGDWDRLSFEDMHCGHGVHTDTGIGNCDAIALQCLTYFWAQMLPVFVAQLGRQRRHHLIKVYFYLIFVMIKFYQPVDSFHRWFHWGRAKNTICVDTFYDWMVPMVYLMAQHVNEIHWDDRLAWENHHVHADDFVTFLVDSFPQEVWAPLDPLCRSLLFVPQKYCSVIYKLHIATDLIGNVIHFIGLNPGVEPDGTIWDRVAAEHPTEPDEFGYGDSAYSGCEDIVTNFTITLF